MLGPQLLFLLIDYKVEIKNTTSLQYLMSATLIHIAYAFGHTLKMLYLPLNITQSQRYQIEKNNEASP